MGTTSIREDWEGRSVDGKFALLEWLGGSADSGVFLTVLGGVQRAVIKLIPAEGVDADAQLAQWEKAKALSHIHLMRVLEAGRCAVEGTDLLYVVTEHAEKVLSKFLPEKPLQAHEARNIFEPVLGALSYLHEKGIVHGHIKPSNILVSGGELKISVDDFLVADGVPKPPRKPGIYDAPEVAAGMMIAAADVWSVGISLVEALTQRPPSRDAAAGDVPIVPETLPQPFLEIVQECLRPNPAERCSIADIQGRLAARTESQPVARTEGRAGAGPGDRSEPDIRGTGTGETGTRGFGRKVFTPVVAEQVAAAREPAPAAAQPVGRWEADDEPAPLPTLFKDYEETSRSRLPQISILIGALVLLAVVAFVIMRRNDFKIPWPFQNQSSPAVSQQQVQPQSPTTAPSDDQSASSGSPSAASPTSSSESQSQTPAASPSDTRKTPGTDRAAPQPQSPTASTGEAATATAAGSAVPTPQTAAASPIKNQIGAAASQTEPQSPVGASASSGGTTEGAVASRVLPNVSSSAIESMHGPVVVETRVLVDRTGAVSKAEYITQGPGNYFARISQRAAESWKFKPPQTHGHPEPSVWTLRFYFSRGKTEVSATEEER
jgi:serine/threonine protein kinase